MGKLFQVLVISTICGHYLGRLILSVSIENFLTFLERKRYTNSKKICAVYRDGFIAESSIRKEFAKFRRPMPALIDDGQSKTLIKINVSQHGISQK